MKKETAKKLNDLASEILLDNGSKYLKLVNGEVYIYNKENGIFVLMPRNVSKRKMLIKRMFAKAVKKAAIKYYYQKTGKQYRYDEDYISEYKNDSMEDSRNGFQYNVKRVSKTILNNIDIKINLNSNFYCDNLDNGKWETCIPIFGKCCINSYGNSDSLNYNKGSFYFLNIRENGERLKSNEIFVTFLNAKLNSENSFRKLLLKIGEQNLLEKSIGFARDLFVNNLYDSKKVYLIQYEKKNILNLFLRPFLSLFPDEFVSYYNISNFNLSKNNLKEFLSKRVNVSYSNKKKLTVLQKEFLKQILSDDVFTIKNINITKMPLLILTYKNEEMKEFTDLIDADNRNKISIIKLPDKIDAQFNEPDLVEYFERNNIDILKLCFFQKSEVDEKPFLSLEDKFFEKFIEITGDENDKISADEFYQKYCDFCNYYKAEAKNRANLGKIINKLECFSKLTDKTKWIEWKKQQTSPSFIKNKGSDKMYYYLGLKWKE